MRTRFHRWMPVQQITKIVYSRGFAIFHNLFSYNYKTIWFHGAVAEGRFEFGNQIFMRCYHYAGKSTQLQYRYNLS
jgi:hypothetical protein